MSRAQDEIQRLASFAQAVDELIVEGDAIVREFPNGITDNSVRLLSQASTGLRRSITKVSEKTEREELRAERQAEWREGQQRKAADRKYDDITRLMAQRQGITLEAAQAIRDAAAAEAARVAGLGSLDQQLAKEKTR